MRELVRHRAEHPACSPDHTRARSWLRGRPPGGRKSADPRPEARHCEARRPPRARVAGRALLQPHAVAPQLGSGGHEGVLVLEPAGELVLSYRKRLWIGARLDVVAKRGAERDQSLKRRLAGTFERIGHARRGVCERSYDLGNQLASATQHAESGVDEDRWWV